MKIFTSKLFTSLAFVALSSTCALQSNAAPTTERIPQFKNDKVEVWKTVVYPSTKQMLKMHRHEHDRVVVPLESGKLKITNDHGKVHYLNLKKGKAYFLKKDVPNELHTDENISGHPIEVMVIEFRE